MKTIIDPDKLILPQPNLKARFSDLDFRDCLTFHTNGEPVLVTDPIYLADVYNVPNGLASVVRQRGVIVTDFGGDRSGPIFWQFPFALLAFGTRHDPPEAAVLAEEVGCDSGSFVFLPVTADLPPALTAKIADVLEKKNGASLVLPAGEWTVLFEQHQPRFNDDVEDSRNIVLRWEPSENVQPRLFPL